MHLSYFVFSLAHYFSLISLTITQRELQIIGHEVNCNKSRVFISLNREHTVCTRPNEELMSWLTNNRRTEWNWHRLATRTHRQAGMNTMKHNIHVTHIYINWNTTKFQLISEFSCACKQSLFLCVVRNDELLWVILCLWLCCQ